MLEQILQTDRDLLIFLNTLGSPQFDSFWSLLSEKWFWIPLYLYFLYIIKRFYGWKGLMYAIIFASIGTAISDQMASLFKNSGLRLRPCHDPLLEGKIREIKCGGKFGFYSGHSSNTAFAASFIYFIFKKIKKTNLYFAGFLLFWWLMVAYSRIYLGVHYPGDVVVGGAVGLLLGWFMSVLFNKTIHKTI